MHYQEHVAVFSISPVALISGSIPQRQQRLVEAWAELRSGRAAFGLESSSRRSQTCANRPSAVA
jgi:Domain of unknown function (DUF4160)